MKNTALSPYKSVYINIPLPVLHTHYYWLLHCTSPHTVAAPVNKVHTHMIELLLCVHTHGGSVAVVCEMRQLHVVGLYLCWYIDARLVVVRWQLCG